MRRILDMTLAALLLAAALIGVGTGVQFPDRDHRVCRATWCQPGQTYATAQAWINDQVRAAGCQAVQRPQTIPSGIMAVAAKDGEGTSVAKRYDFDTAWTLARAGTVRVVGYCYQQTRESESE